MNMREISLTIAALSFGLPAKATAQDLPLTDSLHWDNGVWKWAIGSTDNRMVWAVRFTIPGYYQGWTVLRGGVHMYGPPPFPNPGSMRLYKGTATEPGYPGPPIAEHQMANDSGWQAVDFSSDGVTLNAGDELWLVCIQEHSGSGQLPASADTGPDVPGYSDWFYYSGDSTWMELGSLGFHASWMMYVIIYGTSVEEGGAGPAFDLSVYSPCRGQASILYSLPASGLTTLSVYDVCGRPVAVPVNGNMGRGRYCIALRGLSPGSYIVSLRQGVRAISRTLMIY
ncbi:MAG: T9SS type A sorting domain-containing protein [candidate division WOR-3 bacterium]